jgi:hypothetical protein
MKPSPWCSFSLETAVVVGLQKTNLTPAQSAAALAAAEATTPKK